METEKNPFEAVRAVMIENLEKGAKCHAKLSFGRSAG
jgi:hypothetical protein